MKSTKSDAIAAAIMSLVTSLLPFLVLVGVLDWTGDTVAAASLVVGNAVTLGGLIFAQSTSDPFAPGG